VNEMPNITADQALSAVENIYWIAIGISLLIPVIIGLSIIIYNLLKRLYSLSTDIAIIRDRQEGQLSMSGRLQESLAEIQEIKLLCNERHKWDGKERRLERTTPTTTTPPERS
jgi:hypothetical protein